MLYLQLMLAKKHIIFFFIALLYVPSILAQENDVQQASIANNYYNQGEFEKALLIYKKLYEKKPYSFNYLYKIVDSYQQLEQYDLAEAVLRSRLEKRTMPAILIELGYNYQLIDSITEAKELYTQAINTIDSKPNNVYTIGLRFEKHFLLEEAIITYKKGATLLPERNFNAQLARIYGDLGDIENMFSSYIDYVAYKPSNLNNIKRSLNQFVSENKANDNNKKLRVLLLKRIQAQPDIHWYDLLSWLYVQEKQYGKSFVQEKALYKRNPESLDRIIDLAYTALDNDDTDTAVSIFNYLLEASQDNDNILLAHQALLEIDTERATTAKDLQQIDKQYQKLFSTYGLFGSTLQLQLSYGEFLAFHFNQPVEASTFLRRASKLDISNYQQALVKLKLADILVLQEKFNEALIYYTQIKANLKNSTIAQEAAYKIAKTSYYKGDFDWAESQLKVLKSSTTQLIANDALDLKLTISDNKYDDTTQTALSYYAKANLFAFQNKTEEAIKLLDKVLTEHNGESITDQALFTQAKLYEKQKQYEKAKANYQKIITDYPEEILIDDAHYYLAELYIKHLGLPEEAKPLFEKIIFEYKDSIYFVEARKKFRMLRGDTIN